MLVKQHVGGFEVALRQEFGERNRLVGHANHRRRRARKGREAVEQPGMSPSLHGLLQELDPSIDISMRRMTLQQFGQAKFERRQLSDGLAFGAAERMGDALLMEGVAALAAQDRRLQENLMGKRFRLFLHIGRIRVSGDIAPEGKGALVIADGHGESPIGREQGGCGCHRTLVVEDIGKRPQYDGLVRAAADPMRPLQQGIAIGRLTG
ncbi:hypothetical protein [Bosea sp. AAP35]|uniref:hypothetical protein n=1 Tax=Bosea sp. AAP35 TaxID=1523417 RepID=UPI0012E20CFA|nr:hypothetical protein [Bosea sp. AAP35]